MCERGEVPAHDVLVTNPPYSADHVEKCITFAAKNLYEHGRPYFLLLPSYCVNKPYYTSALLTGGAEGKRARAAREEAEGGTKTKEEDGNTSGDEMRQEEEEETEEEEEEDGKGFKVHDGGKARSKKIATRDGGSRRQTLPFYVAPVKRYYYWTPKPHIAARKAQQGVDESEGVRKKSRSGGWARGPPFSLLLVLRHGRRSPTGGAPVAPHVTSRGGRRVHGGQEPQRPPDARARRVGPAAARGGGTREGGRGRRR